MRTDRKCAQLDQTPSAVIFDCDGVLVDSEPLANRVMSDLLREHGISLTPIQCMQRFVGLTVEFEAAAIRSEFGIDLEAVLERELTKRTIEAFARDLRASPGICDIMGRLTVSAAVASNSRRNRVIAALSATGLLDYFGGRIATSDFVPRPKPSPDVYLAAAELLAVAANQCLAIEDSPSGVAAARVAGMPVVGYVGAGCEDAKKIAALTEAGSFAVMSHWNELPGICGAIFRDAHAGN